MFLRSGELVGQVLYMQKAVDSQYWLDPVIDSDKDES